MQVSVAIVSQQIIVPTIATVIDSCSFSYSIIETQRDEYISCVERQLSTCSADFDRASVTESARVNHAQSHNNNFLQTFQAISNNCSKSFASTKQSLKTWSDTGVGYDIPFQQNCSNINRNKVLSLIGSSSSNTRTNIFENAITYTGSSDSTLSHISDYGIALAAYNEAYVNNKTLYVQAHTQKMVDSISSKYLLQLNHSFDDVFRSLNELVACVSLDNSSTCYLPFNAHDLYTDVAFIVNWEFDYLKNSFYFGSIQKDVNSYMDTLHRAINSANSFYDSVAGAQGIMNWIKRNFNVGVVTSTLCGHSSPNWCTFSKVRFHLFVCIAINTYSRFIYHIV